MHLGCGIRTQESTGVAVETAVLLQGQLRIGLEQTVDLMDGDATVLFPGDGTEQLHQERGRHPDGTRGLDPGIAQGETVGEQVIEIR